MAFFIFSTSDPNSTESAKENQTSGAEDGGSLSEGAVAQNEVEGEKGQGAGRGGAKGNSQQGEAKSKQEANTQSKSQTKDISRAIPPYASGFYRPTSLVPNEPTEPFQIDPKKSIAEILGSADLSDPATRSVVSAYMADREKARYQAVVAQAKLMGIPLRIDGPGHNVSILYDIRPDGPLYRKTLNTNAAISTGANLLNQNPYGLNGQGMTVGVWDAARARTNHVELAGKVTVGDSTTANDDHSTHVAGTIAAKGVDPKAKGMGTNTLIRTYDWNTDYAEMTAIGAATASQGATKIPISNHSYGYNATAADMGRYETECNTLDALALSLPYYLVFWAAGNEQDTLNTVGNGYQSITFNGLAKNILTVGAADDAVTAGVRDVSKGTLAYFSSMGPCDDGRIKPDIVANGVNVYSCIASNNNTSYDGTYSGTSMATPNAAGTAALLVQLYKTNFSGQIMRASMLKALIIHTADDVGRPGPDYQYGWGYMNGKAAADLILEHKASLAAPKMIENSVTSSNKTRATSFVWDGTNPIRATLVWTDVEGAAQTATNSRTRNLINDLDLKITAPDGTTSYLPYVMPFVGVWTTNSMTSNAVTGTNKVDNVERVDIPAPTQAGTYTVSVGMYGTNLLSGASQTYSLIVTGGQNVEANPPPVVNITAPADGVAVLPNSPVTITATATDMAIGGVPGSVTKVEFFEGDTLLGEDTTSPYSYSWTPSASGVRVLTAKATDNENASTVSSGVNVTVLVGDGSPTISSFSPSGGVAGDTVTIIGNNLGNVSSVRFGSLAAAFVTKSITQIAATVPSAAVTAPITVSNSYGAVTTTNNFSILPILFREDFSSITGGNNTSSGGSSTAWAGNTNFPTGVNDYEAGGAVKLGTSKAAGSITSRAINLAGNGGAFTLSFKVKGWSTLEGQIKVTAGTQSQTVSYTATMSGEFETKSLNFTGGTSATTIKIETTAGRAYIDDVTVTSEAPSLPPVITSPTAAGGIVGQAFSYQITASNSPTSFGASSLPAWATINTTSGVISGATPTAGTNVVTLSASNSVGVGSTNLTITILASGGGGGGTLLNENFLALTNGADTSTNTASTTEVTNNLTTNFPISVKAYSAGGSVKLGSSSLPGSITSRSLDLSGNNGTFALTFKVKGWSTVESGIKVTVGSLPPQTVTYTSVLSGSYETKTLNFTGGQANSTIKIETTNKRAFIDDVVVTASAPTPSITSSGSLVAVNTVYGTASPSPASFTVSGANLAAGITVVPPIGFEVSASNPNSFAGKGNSVIVGSAGTVASTTVFVRLAADTDAGTYSGDIVCSSVGASNAAVATVSSTVSAKPVTVSANLIRKTYGSEDPELTYTPSELAPFSGALTRDPGENVGLYAISQGTLSAGANYAITFTGNNLEIMRKNISITGLAGVNKVYDGETTAEFAGTAAYDGLVNGESFAVSGTPVASFGSAGVGSDKAVAVTGYNAPSSNYNLLPVTLSANITAKSVVIYGVVATNKVYDGTLAAGLSGTPQLTDVLVSDAGNVSVGGTPAAQFASANVGTSIAVTVSGYSLSGSAAANYLPVQPSGLTASITPRPATVTAGNRNKPRGQVLTLGPNQTNGFSVTGLVVGEKVDQVTLMASGGTEEGASNGDYTITPSDAVASAPANLFQASNYNITYIPGTLLVVDPITEITLAEWASKYPNLTDPSPNADPDGDGMSNLMEFFLGLDPTQSGGISGPVMTLSNGPSNTLTMSYRRAKGVAGISSGVQTIGDLSTTNWGTNGVQETVTDTADPLYEQVTVTVTNPPGATKMFMRLKVSQP